VVRDFHQQSLYNPIEPLIMVYRTGQRGVIHIKIKTKNTKPRPWTISVKKWQSNLPGQACLNTVFWIRIFESAYRADELRGKFCSDVFGTDDPDRLPRAVWTGDIHDRAAGEGNWGAESAGRIGFQRGAAVVEGLYEAWCCSLSRSPFRSPTLAMDRWLQSFPYKAPI
jgi:putative ABC transport system permease protein